MLTWIISTSFSGLSSCAPERRKGTTRKPWERGWDYLPNKPFNFNQVYKVQKHLKVTGSPATHTPEHPLSSAEPP